MPSTIELAPRDGEPAAHAATAASGRRRAILWIVSGAALIYASTWLGPLGFYWSFQKPLAQGGKSPSSLVWRSAVEVPPAAPSGWTSLEAAPGLGLLVPPGPQPELRKDGADFVVAVGGHELRYTIFPRGFLTELYRAELQRIGGVAADSPRDDEVLLALAAAQLGDYRPGAPESERSRYAARILCKMLLWESSGLRRFESARDPELGSVGVLAQLGGSGTKVVVAGPSRVAVVLIPDAAPADWTSSPGHWLGLGG